MTTDLTVRRCTEDDRVAVGRLTTEAFSASSTPFPEADAISIDNRWVAVDAAGVAATILATPVGQWFGGRLVSSIAVRAVAVATGRRGGGVGSRMVQQVLQQTRESGIRLSVLYPSVPGPYRSAGYEFAGDHFIMSAPLLELPRKADLPVEELDADNLAAVTDCYEATCAGRPGSIQRTEPFWRDAVIRNAGSRYLYAVREDGRITGYVAYTKEKSPGSDMHYYFDVAIADMAWTTPAAGRALLAGMSAHSGLGLTLRWPGRPGDLWSRMLGGYAPRVAFQYPWMLRLIDVEGALTDRGYPAELSAAVELAVVDRKLPDNGGAYRIEVAGGSAKVLRTDSASATIGVGPLAALYAGYVTAAELAEEGALTGASPADIATLDAAFTGPRPLLNEMF